MASFTDTFTRADNADLGASYTAMTGATTLQIVGNAVRCTTAGGAENFERYSGITPGAGQFVEVTLKTYTHLTNVVYAWGSVRCDPAANTAYNFISESGGPLCYIQKRVTGSNTTIVSDNASGSWAATDVIRGEIDSSSNMTFYRNGVSELTITDSTIPGPGQIGLGMYLDDVGLANGEIEEFSGGDWPAVADTFMPRSFWTHYQAVKRGAVF